MLNFFFILSFFLRTTSPEEKLATFLPKCFDLYKAWSALSNIFAKSTSLSFTLAIPKLQEIFNWAVLLFSEYLNSIDSNSSIRVYSFSSSIFLTYMTNSSPPYLPTRWFSPPISPILPAIFFKYSSPIVWPNVSFASLKLSRSITIK